MKWKFEEEFRLYKPETIGETDIHFDLDNYKDWLEFQLSEARKQLSIFGVSSSYSAEDMSKAWSEGYHRKVDEINGNELRYFDVWLANYR